MQNDSLDPLGMALQQPNFLDAGTAYLAAEERTIAWVGATAPAPQPSG